MKEDFQPLLHPVEITALRPTQMTIGLLEVSRKRTEWRKRAEQDGPEFLGKHMIPAVIGPDEKYYLIDHHHLVRALHDEGVTHVLVSIIADLGKLKKSTFWTFMDNRNWLHPFDEEGKRQDHDSIPKAIGKLGDDPYRSLAGAVRRAGGFAKDPMPYGEFLWADYFRRRIPLKPMAKDFGQAVVKALDLAHHKEADYLPGWCGPAD